MRGSFKQIKKKECGALLCRTQPYFSLRLFGCLHYRALTFLFSLTHFILTLYRSCLCMYIRSFHPNFLFLLFLTCSLLCLALLQLDHLFFFVVVVVIFSSSSSPCPFAIFTLTVSVYYSSKW